MLTFSLHVPVTRMYEFGPGRCQRCADRRKVCSICTRTVYVIVRLSLSSGGDGECHEHQKGSTLPVKCVRRVQQRNKGKILPSRPFLLERLA